MDDTPNDDAKRSVDWSAGLVEQLSFHWEHLVRPHLDGLTDDEYLWEPVPGMWSVRPRATARTNMAAGSGPLVVEFEHPEPAPAPVTTIAWRLGHLIVGVLGARNASHFGGPPVDYATMQWPPTAAAALARLDDEYATWIAGVAGLDAARLAAPVGPAEGDFAEYPYATLVLHINREMIHHAAEVLLLRDLYRARSGVTLS